MYNVSFIHIRSELPSMTVFQVLSLLEPWYER